MTPSPPVGHSHDDPSVQSNSYEEDDSDDEDGADDEMQLYDLGSMNKSVTDLLEVSSDSESYDDGSDVDDGSDDDSSTIHSNDHGDVEMDTDSVNTRPNENDNALPSSGPQSEGCPPSPDINDEPMADEDIDV